MALTLLLLGGSTKAHAAGYEEWGCSLAAGQIGCREDRHALRSVAAYTGSSILLGAGASTTMSAGDAVGGYSWGRGYACTTYPGTQMLYPFLANGTFSWQAFTGYTTYGYGADGC